MSTSSEIDKRWLENALTEEGHSNLLSEVPETRRYVFLEEQDDSVIIKDDEENHPPITYDDIRSLTEDLENYEEGRYSSKEKEDGAVRIYSEAREEWIESDNYVDLEEIS